MNAAFVDRILDREVNEPTVELARIFDEYDQGNVKGLNNAVADYMKLLDTEKPLGLSINKTNFEAFFNHAEPFYHSSVLYILAFSMSAFAWLAFRRTLDKAAFWLIAFTFVLHTAALIARMYISGRPPVTNLYSSAVFISWGCVGVGMVLEAVYRIGVGNAVASIAGFISLLIAHFLAGDGDTFVVLQAVLDTQIWLAMHVVCVTFGYAVTFFAGFLGMAYIAIGLVFPWFKWAARHLWTNFEGAVDAGTYQQVNRSLDPYVPQNVTKSLGSMIYGTVCFALFFSFFGTVLGGLWADDSWGRFWGWDPKENGALIIVLWNAVILHARWGGMVKERGMAILAIFGNIVTAWSWFGVNELGVGLHSYGFTEGVLLTLLLFVMSQLIIVGIGLLPKTFWWTMPSTPAKPAT